MEMSETNLSGSELINSDLKKSEIHGPLELELFDINHNLIAKGSDKQIEKVAKALSSETRRRILNRIQTSKEGLDVSDIASILGMTEANISAQIKKLQKADLIYCEYCSGQHGVRKISKLKFEQLVIKF
ncbi:MAG: transcriptional regulator [Promethearchaeota archaeon Loki_b31]|nr:MAG: transcriptional regulator [Candidatus Lokiarchaeota archaeon Loki_b31]